LHPNEFRFEPWLPILKKHAHDFLKVALKFVEAVALAMGPGPTRNVSDEQAGVRITLDDEVEASHGYPRPSGYACRRCVFNATVCRTQS
jgi:hypothetical protein